MKKILAALVIVITIIGSMYSIVFEAVRHAEIAVKSRSVGEAAQGIASVLSTTSTAVVGPQSGTLLFPEKSFCAARIISTGSNPIMLAFTSAILTSTATSTTNPSGSNGFQQAASTTVAYNSGLYGCPAVTAYGFTASTTVSIAEFQ